MIIGCRASFAAAVFCLGAVFTNVLPASAQPSASQESKPKSAAAEKQPGSPPGLTAELLAKSAAMDGRLAQPKPLLKKFIDGPHTCPADQAVVGVEVENVLKDGTSEKRHVNGLLLRCDGFFLVARESLSRAMSGGKEADAQILRVTLNPGTPLAKQASAFANPFISKSKAVHMVMLKLRETHIPAARPLLPGALTAADTLQIAWTDWNAQTGRFGAVQRREVKVAVPPKSAQEADLLPGEIQLTEPLSGVPTGAAVVGPDGMAVGIVPTPDARRDRFLSLIQLNLVSSAIAAAPTTDAVFAQLQHRPEEEAGAAPAVADANEPPAAPPPPAGDTPQGQAGAPGEASGERKHPRNEMVKVPGGPIKMPAYVADSHPEMAGDLVACTPDFMIDRYKVSNREYYDFWLSVPQKERMKPEVRAALYPIAWAATEPPFPKELDDTPVLGVPLTGAQAYARSQGKRLPTAYEWCRAAFGPLGDHAVPDWALQYMRDKQSAWQRLVLSHLEYLFPILQDDYARYMANHIGFNVSTTTKPRRSPIDGRLSIRTRVDYLAKKVSSPVADLVTPTIPFLSIYEPYRQLESWSKQQFDIEAKQICDTWVDPLYVIPGGSRPFDVSPFGVSDMLLNGNERVVAAPQQTSGTEYMKIRWMPGFAEPKWLAGLGNSQLESWYTKFFPPNDPYSAYWFSRPLLLSRRLVAASQRVQPDQNQYSPSYHQQFVELYSRFAEIAEIVKPVNGLSVLTQYTDTFQSSTAQEDEYRAEWAAPMEAGTHYTDLGAEVWDGASIKVRYRWYAPAPLGPEYAGVPYSNPSRQHEGGQGWPDERYGFYRGIYFNETPWFPLWQGISPYQRREMGRDAAQDPPVRVGAPPRADGKLYVPGEIYLVPNGFRCAR